MHGTSQKLCCIGKVVDQKKTKRVFIFSVSHTTKHKNAPKNLYVRQRLSQRVDSECALFINWKFVILTTTIFGLFMMHLSSYAKKISSSVTVFSLSFLHEWYRGKGAEKETTISWVKNFRNALLVMVYNSTTFEKKPFH